MVERRWSMIATNTVAWNRNDVERDLQNAPDGYYPSTARSNLAMPMAGVSTRKRSRRGSHPTEPLRQASWPEREQHLAKRRPSLLSIAGGPVVHPMNGPLEKAAEPRHRPQMEVHTQLLRKHSYIGWHHNRIATFRRSEPSVVRSDRSATTSALRFQQPHSEELIWRRVPASRFTGGDEVEGQTPRPAVNRTQTRSQASDESPPVASTVTELAPPQQITKIDPALLDRLTDNIISRVEKRISIERERRGL
jgi:hypothetical protein